MSIPEIKDYSKGRMIPPEVAEPTSREEPEALPFLISYAKYKNKLCEIDNLQKNCPKKILQDLKKIGNEITNFNDFYKNGIGVKPVHNNGEYKMLFNGLHPDVELYEHILQGTARMFYFIIDLLRNNLLIYLFS